MTRINAFALMTLLASAPLMRGADTPAGTWRLALPLGEGHALTLLTAFENKGGQWTGKLLGATADLPMGTAIDNVRLAGERLQFTLSIDGQELTFDARLPSAGPKIVGSMFIDGQLILAALEPSKVTTFDRFELLKEIVTQSEPSLAYFEAAAELLRQAGQKKVKPEEVRTWLESVNKAAMAYGIRWQQAVALRLAQALIDHKEYAALALDEAQRAVRLLGPADPPTTHLHILETYARMLQQHGKADDAKPILALATQAEANDYQDYRSKFPFKPDQFTGRKGPGNRVMLVELFTGTECPPCVATELAFDGLERTYKPVEVLRLQYHVNIPGPDPLTNATTLARQKYYAVRGTPATFFNGKSDGEGGGDVRNAVRRFTQFRAMIDSQIELPAEAKVQLTASRTDDKLSVRAKVSELQKPGERLRLRIMLTEEMLRCRGSNGIRYHHAVVRSAFGSDGGFPLRQGTVEYLADLNLAELRKTLAADLEKYQKEVDELPNPDGLLALKKLTVVAFVQDDGTQAILQSTSVDVK